MMSIWDLFQPCVDLHMGLGQVMEPFHGCPCLVFHRLGTVVLENAFLTLKPWHIAPWLRHFSCSVPLHTAFQVLQMDLSFVYSVLACAPPFKYSCCFPFFNKTFFSIAGLFVSFSFYFAQVMASVLVTFLFARVSPALSGISFSCISDCLWPGAR